jgi:hypothetical protein
MKITSLSRMLAGLVGVAAATTASAQIVINFDDSTNPFSTGTISTNQSVSGSSSLFLAQGQTATFAIPSEFSGKEFNVTLKYFDLGNSTSSTGRVYGPRWGVGSSFALSDFVAGAISNASFLNSNLGYAYSAGSGNQTFDGSWFGPSFLSGTDRSTVIGTGGTWTDWSFNISEAGLVSMQQTGVSQIVTFTPAGGVTQIMLNGGNSAELAGAYFDDITITAVSAVPEPETYAVMLGTLALGFIAYRRRRQRAQA